MSQRYDDAIARLGRFLRLDSGGSRADGKAPSLLAQPLLDYYVVLATTVLLAGVGVLMSLSSSSVYAQSLGKTPYYFATRQLLFLLMGAVAATIASRLGPDRLRKLGGLVAGFVILMLVLVFTPLGADAGKGNRSWLVLGPIGLQPSEFAKFALVLVGSAFLARRRRTIGDIKEIAGYLGLYGVFLLLIVAQGDLGTTLVLGTIMLAQMWAFGVPRRYVFGVVTLAVVAAVGLILTTPYRLARVMSFLDPNSGSSTSDQPLAAIYALATGGWWGVGIGASRQKWGGLYDGAQNDFVFAVLGEEMGLVGTLVVILLFALLCWAGIRIAMRSDVQFLRVAAATVTAWTAVQALMNMSVSLNLLPVVGVPLPLISIGGSALVSNLAAIGVLLACARNEPAARRRLEVSRRKAPPRVTTVVDGGRRG